MDGIQNDNARQIVRALVEKSISMGYKIEVVDPEDTETGYIVCTDDAAEVMANLQTMDGKDTLYIWKKNDPGMIGKVFLDYQPEPWDGTDVIRDYTFRLDTVDEMTEIMDHVEQVEESLGAEPRDGDDDWSPAEPSPSRK